MFSLWHWMILLIFAAVLIIPTAKILKRVGLSPWLSILAIIPFLNWVFLWILAFIPWPIDKSGPETS